MRPGQHNKRGRGRGRRHGGGPGGGGGGGGSGGGNPLSRVYDSNGPDVKVRGTAQTVADKYLQLGRDAQAAGDNVMAESCFQHAEHYLRILAAAQAYNQQLQAQYRPQDDFGDDGEEGDGPEGEDQPPATVERPAMAAAQQSDEGAQSGFDPPPPREQREFRPRNDRFRPRYDRQDRGYRDNNAEPQAPAPRPEAEAQPAERSAAPEAQAAEDNSWGSGPQPSFLRRPAAGNGQTRQRSERRRREPAAEAEAETPAREDAPSAD